MIIMQIKLAKYGAPSFHYFLYLIAIGNLKYPSFCYMAIMSV